MKAGPKPGRWRGRPVLRCRRGRSCPGGQRTRRITPMTTVDVRVAKARCEQADLLERREHCSLDPVPGPAAAPGELIERLDDRGAATGLAVLAPHGGGIEPGTEAQAELVGRRLGSDRATVWQCRGRWRGRLSFERWHITSTDIDPRSFPRGPPGRGRRRAQRQRPPRHREPVDDRGANRGADRAEPHRPAAARPRHRRGRRRRLRRTAQPGVRPAAGGRRPLRLIASPGRTR